MDATRAALKDILKLTVSKKKQEKPLLKLIVRRNHLQKITELYFTQINSIYTLPFRHIDKRQAYK